MPSLVLRAKHVDRIFIPLSPALSSACQKMPRVWALAFLISNRLHPSSALATASAQKDPPHCHPAQAKTRGGWKSTAEIGRMKLQRCFIPVSCPLLASALLCFSHECLLAMAGTLPSHAIPPRCTRKQPQYKHTRTPAFSHSLLRRRGQGAGCKYANAFLTRQSANHTALAQQYNMKICSPLLLSTWTLLPSHKQLRKTR